MVPNSYDMQLSFQSYFGLQIAIILGRFPGVRELMDAKLFLNKELDKELKSSSKMKYASDFISLGTRTRKLNVASCSCSFFYCFML